MAEIINFSHEEEMPDLDGMSRDQLLAWLREIREQIAQLDALEPGDMESEAFEAWGERHETLEDLADDILDRLDALEQ